MTISAWVNAVAYNNFSRILDFGNGPLPDNTILALSYFSTGLPYFYAARGTTQLFYFDTPSPIPSNTWVHVVATCDGIRECIYFNGIQQVQANSPANRTKVTTVFNYLGRSNWSADSYLNGSLDDIRLYDRALSADEVAFLYALESQSTVQPPPTLTANLGPGPDLNLNFSGFPGSNYVLQTATNLTPPIQWLPVLTNPSATNGIWQFTDTNLNSAQKFYRVTTP